MQSKSIRIDLGKNTFHLIAPESRSQITIRKKFSRSRLMGERGIPLPPLVVSGAFFPET
jgi:hypothetical protein